MSLAQNYTQRRETHHLMNNYMKNFYDLDKNADMGIEKIF